MINDNNTNYQYNRCISRGICSVNPATSSLQEVILLYLKNASYYGLKLFEAGKTDEKIQTLILNTISVLSSSYELSKINFEMIISAFKSELPRIIKEYDKVCSGCKKPEMNELLTTGKYLNDYIRYGESEINKRILHLKHNENGLYKILFNLVKSFCTNIQIYKSYGQKAEPEMLFVLKILNLLNTRQKSKKFLKKLVIKLAVKDCNLMKKIRIIQEKVYGEQREQNVSFSTAKGKAILVVGSNIRELEYISEVFKDKDIDIYTHDKMILAHTFPEFGKYKNIKGQYGHGMENCLLDFSTFPGPIILTRNSLFNVESLYRGRLYTTDLSYLKGVINIKNNDFSEVIKSAEESKGFKTGKECISVKVGFSLKEVISKIKEKVSVNTYNNVIVIGTGSYSSEAKEYFNLLVKHVPSDVLVISLFCCEQKDNVICANAFEDVYGMVRLIDEIRNICSRKMSVFFPYSDSQTLSAIIKSIRYKNSKIFIGSWSQTIVTPDIFDILKKEFEISEVTSPKKDLDIILNMK